MAYIDDSDPKIIEDLARGDAEAERVLRFVPHDRLRTLALDLDDMLMSGEQIAQAWLYCGSSPLLLDDAEVTQRFIEACAARDLLMIAHVNSQVTDRAARAHGPQTTVPQGVDAAVAGVLREAEAAGRLSRLDEGAYYVNLLFRRVLEGGAPFNATYSMNTGTDGIWAKFSIQLTGFVHADGTPWAPPQKESASDALHALDAILADANAEPPPHDGNGRAVAGDYSIAHTAPGMYTASPAELRRFLEDVATTTSVVVGPTEDDDGLPVAGDRA